MSRHKFNGPAPKSDIANNERVYSPEREWIATHQGDMRWIITHTKKRSTRIPLENATATQAQQAVNRLEGS